MLKNSYKIFKKPIGSDSGFTIIEMLVAMAIAAIFFASFIAVVMATVQTMRTGDARTVAQQNGRIAINFLADEIKQMEELETPPFNEYRDLRTGGLPGNGEVVDANMNEVYPIRRLSTDGSLRGYIDLNHKDATGGVDEYEDFRSDGRPYDVRPLFPNKINFLMNQSAFFPHTRYSNLNPDLAGVGGVIDIDGISADAANNSDNAQAAKIRVSYEHQKQPPRWGLLSDEGTIKNLYLPVLGGQGGGVNLFDKPFILLRDFQIDNVTADTPNNTIENGSISVPRNLIDVDNNPAGVQMVRPSEDLREIVADHVMDIRFRYFYIAGANWIEIKYDPETPHMGQGSSLPANVNDGYYRYYDRWGNEIFAWALPGGTKIDVPDADSTVAEIIDHYSTEYDGANELTFMPADEYQRGLLLFEGWRYVNAVMITVKSGSSELQTKYLATISNEIKNNDISHPDYGLGFVDFQKGTDYWNDAAGLNSADPLWHALDSYRDGIAGYDGGSDYLLPDDENGFDFVDPNLNPSFDPGRFVTLQTIVAPPILQAKSKRRLARSLWGSVIYKPKQVEFSSPGDL